MIFQNCLKFHSPNGLWNYVWQFWNKIIIRGIYVKYHYKSCYYLYKQRKAENTREISRLDLRNKWKLAITVVDWLEPYLVEEWNPKNFKFSIKRQVNSTKKSILFFALRTNTNHLEGDFYGVLQFPRSRILLKSRIAGSDNWFRRRKEKKKQQQQPGEETYVSLTPNKHCNQLVTEWRSRHRYHSTTFSTSFFDIFLWVCNNFDKFEAVQSQDVLKAESVSYGGPENGKFRMHNYAFKASWLLIGSALY